MLRRELKKVLLDKGMKNDTPVMQRVLAIVSKRSLKEAKKEYNKLNTIQRKQYALK